MHTGVSGGDYNYGYDAEHAAHKAGSFFDKLRGKTSSAESDAENYARGGARNVRNAGRDVKHGAQRRQRGRELRPRRSPQRAQRWPRSG
jgi:hypothetical protein